MSPLSLGTARMSANAGDPRGALETVLAILSAHPADQDALLFAGELNAALGQSASAVQHYRRLVALAPTSAIALRKLANELVNSGELAEGIAAYRQSLQFEPHVARAHNNLGRALEQTGNLEEAEQCYRHAMELDERYGLAFHNLANLLSRRGEHENALPFYERALALRPELAESWFGSARSLLSLARAEESLPRIDQALSRKRPYPEAWSTRALALMELQRSEDALTAVRAALTERPTHAESLCILGDLMRQRGEAQAAVESFKRALEADERCDAARFGAALAEIPALRNTPQETLESRTRLRTALLDLQVSLTVRPCADAGAAVGSVQPFYLAYQEHDNRELLGIHGRICSEAMAQWQRDQAIASPRPSRGSDSKLRVGIVSAQVFDHSVFNAITRGWLQSLDPDRFEIHLFDLSRRQDAATQFARTRVSHYESGQRSPLEWVRAIQAQSPDVLLYPEIGMDPKTLPLASLRLAPVQAASWGHPETTGLPTIDYFLSGDACEPPGAEQHYTEKLVRLPNLGCYYEPITQTAPERNETSVPRNAEPVLLCAGTPFKYSPEHDGVFVAIARRLGRCKFQFFSHQDGLLTARLLARLHSAFASAGLDATQYIAVQPWSTPAAFRRTLQSADLLLDTIGFSGFNTALQALECGLPVVAYSGRFMRGRLAAGLVERMGLAQQLVAAMPECFVERVVSLAKDRQIAAQVRAQIRQTLPVVYRDTDGLRRFEDFLIDATRGVA